jgi:hypothetical protein
MEFLKKNLTQLGRGWGGGEGGAGIFFWKYIKIFLRGLREVVHLGSFGKAIYSNNILVSYIAPLPPLFAHLFVTTFCWTPSSIGSPSPGGRHNRQTKQPIGAKKRTIFAQGNSLDWGFL